MAGDEEKPTAAMAAADRIRQATLNASKGLSRAQAERAATAAARNVNAYGQKEEGPSRWQERKELKMRMYSESPSRQRASESRADKVLPGAGSQQCQKCFGARTLDVGVQERARCTLARPSRTPAASRPASSAQRLGRCRHPRGGLPDVTEGGFLRDRDGGSWARTGGKESGEEERRRRRRRRRRGRQRRSGKREKEKAKSGDAGGSSGRE